MAKFAILFVSLTLLGSPATLLGQGSGPVPPLPAEEPGPFYHHASTIEQGFLDGWAAVIRADGLADYNHGLAAVYWQRALEHSYRNRATSIEARFNAKHRNRYHRRLLAGPLMTTESAARINRTRLPNRASLDVASSTRVGKVGWPAALRGVEFVEHRTQIERLFAGRRSSESGRGTQNQQDIKRVVRSMEDCLKGQVKQHGIDSYLAAKRFLRGLDYEGYFHAENSPSFASQPLRP